jgi:hypothetical protein
VLAGAIAVCDAAGLAAVEAGAAAGAGAGAAAVEGALGVEDEPPPSDEFWHPPRASPTQATAKPSTLRFMIFPPDVTT